MFRFRFIFFISFTFPFCLKAQNTYLNSGSDEVHLLNRLETFSGKFSDRLFLDDPYVSRNDAYDFLNSAKSDFLFSGRSNVDNYNINRALSINGEWANLGDDAKNSRNPFLNTFYKKQSDLLRWNKNGIFFSLNPVIGLETVMETQSNKLLFNTAAGLEFRGKVKDRLGFYFFMTHNYEEPVAYQQDFINRWNAIPGAGGFNKIGNGYQYLKVRGYADVALIKDHISLSAGYDQHFIGDGIRSLFLSDFSEGALFASLNTKIWRLNYRNIYLRLVPQNFPGVPSTTGYKYATIHHLSANIRPWLNIGLFESVTFSREGHYEIGYMNPIIFYRALERSMGSPDKVAIGMDAKAIILKRVNLYAQFLINEFTAKEFFGNNGYWANKWALQLGGKYYNGFGVRNLDLQLEMNLIRPYTYTHSNRVEGETIANYSHFNQALAHPLGAGLAEWIGTIHYQPFPRLAVDIKGMYYKQGIDTGNSNLGNDIFVGYDVPHPTFGVSLVNGPAGSCMMGSLNVSYELRPRFYFDIGGTFRKYTNVISDAYTQKDLFFNAGVRLNLNRKTRDF